MYRLIESDSKSCNSLPGAANNSTHSRKSSDTSELSLGHSSDKGSEQETEEDLWITWGRIVNEWETYWKKKNQFVRDLVKRGIPHHFRGIVWQLLCLAHDSPDKAKYADYIKATSACEKVIRRDIARTYPEHDFFKEKDGLGQESLFNVMKAYSLHDREVGYCQGSAFIVGLLLMQMPEEEAFAVLVKLMQDYRLREMFKPSMAELGLCMYQLEMCVQEQYPELHVHFTSQGFHTSMYASSWFLTIFTTSLPLAVASRIMDVFLMDGIEVVFRIALAILSMAKHELLSLDMEGMLKRLRTENKLLKHRIEVLESESSELANKLIQGQVGRAEEVETTFALKRELAAVRQHYLEAMKQLENVTQNYQHLLLVLDETNSTKQTSMDEISLKSELLKQKEELIQCLQNELVEVRLQEAENAVIMSDLRSRIQELEEEKKNLRMSAVDNSVAHLQEELIAVKLREAEASLSLKDLRQKVADLTTQWQKHLQEQEDNNADKKGTGTPLGNLFTSSRMDVQRLEEEVMSLKLREMHTIIELKEHRLKIMELETQVQVTTNQLKRQEDESRRLKEELETSYAQNKDYQSKLKDERRRYSDLESKLKEDSVHARIKDAEKSQRMFDLSQIISSLQLKNQELMAEKEMMSARCVSSSSESNGDKLDSESETTERIKELQDTIATLTIQLESLKEQKAAAAEASLSPAGNGSNSTTITTNGSSSKEVSSSPIAPAVNGVESEP
ncbi:Ecotropic viral integration site 5 protein [Orchesella cincta]|uniref:Ecotropic viral integration site 5 protein n=1 Tax=Orchesella cincta TaxID=48709 RepID=A0A1D2NBS9_ORCCI|nr:Ecotropic viral integration site 5 protein [Orchesella cincta]